MNFLSRLSPLFLLLFLNSCDSPSLPKLMVQRLGWMDQVAQAKQARSQPINDPKREAELLAAMEKLGTASGVPASSVKPFFAGQMQAAKVHQNEWLQSHPPASQQGKQVPDLAKTIRPALDQIGKLMIAELAKNRGSKDAPAIVTEAKHELGKAGYSEAVSAPAIQGLKAGLK